MRTGITWKQLQKKNETREIRLEKLVNDRIRNNRVLTGLEEFCREDMGATVEVESVYRIDEKRCVIKVNNWEDKINEGLKK